MGTIDRVGDLQMMPDPTGRARRSCLPGVTNASRALTILALMLASCAVPFGAAQAQLECGPASTSPAVPRSLVPVVCNNSGVPGANVSPYPNGVNYDVSYPSNATPPGGVDPALGLNLTLTGAAISTTGFGVHGISVQQFPPASITTFTGPTIINTVNGSIATSGDQASGIFAATAGPITITTGNISTTGNVNADGVFASSSTLGLVSIDTTGGTVQTAGSGSIAVSGESIGGGSLTIKTGNITTIGDGSFGVFANGTGLTEVNSTGSTIRTAGDFAPGVFAQASSGPLTVRTGPIETQGFNSIGVIATSFGPGLTTVDTTAGPITTVGDFSYGVLAQALAGGPLTIQTGNVTTSGLSAYGVSGFNSGAGLTTIDTTGGLVTTQGDGANGIWAQISSGALDIRSGNVTTQGFSAPAVAAGGGSSVSINTTGGLLSTAGAQSAGIYAMSLFPDYAATINTGPIRTTGDGAYGVAVGSFALPADAAASSAVTVTNTAPITATGAGAGGIVALNAALPGFLSAPVTVNANADIAASGQNAVGISATSTTGPVTVNVASGTSVMGGWLTNPGDLSTQFSSNAPDGSFIGSNLPAAGIVVFSGATSAVPAMTINNNGIVGALNDRAITMGSPCVGFGGGSGGDNFTFNGGGGSYLKRFASTVLEWVIPSAHASAPVMNPCLPLPSVQSLTVNNSGTVNGYVTFWDGAVHTFNNAATFNMRNFADTNGNGLRDTLGVAVSDFGAPGAIFNNLAGAVVRPLQVLNPAAINSTGQYIPTTGPDSRPLETAVYSMTQNPAITQSQFINVATFTNSGTINLQNGVPGDVFLITGNPTPGGAAGTGVFVSNGGRLLVDTTLNSGIPMGGQTGSISDVLVVDSTRLGAGGATQVLVNNLGGLGALTTGNGIEVVEVRNKLPGMSAAGVFTLGAPVLSVRRQII